jgi:hypothetical protein
MCRTPAVCDGEPRIKRHDVDSLAFLPISCSRLIINGTYPYSLTLKLKWWL